MEAGPNLEKDDHRYARIADQLDALQQKVNDGRGVEHVRWIVEDLRKGDVEAAKASYSNQSDKYSHYPEIKNFLKTHGLIDEIDWDGE